MTYSGFAMRGALIPTVVADGDSSSIMIISFSFTNGGKPHSMITVCVHIIKDTYYIMHVLNTRMMLSREK